MPSRTPPHPPDETPTELAAVLRRNHPELSDAEIAALLVGPTPRRRKGWQAGKQTHAGERGVEARGGLGSPYLRRKADRRR